MADGAKEFKVPTITDPVSVEAARLMRRAVEEYRKRHKPLITDELSESYEGISPQYTTPEIIRNFRKRVRYHIRRKGRHHQP